MDAFWKRFEEYVRSYLPDWQYDREGTEIEAALLTVAAELLADSRQRLSRLPGKHEREFLRPWDTGARGTAPAHAFAALASPLGRPVPAGSEFYLSGNGTRLWKTVEPAQAESARLEIQAFSSARGQVWQFAPLPGPDRPVGLFDFQGENLHRCEVRFTHPDAFASRQECEVRLEFPDADEGILDSFANPADTRWQLVRNETAFPVPTPVREGNFLNLRLSAVPDATSLLVQVLPGRRAPEGRLGRARVWTRRTGLPASAVFREDGGACEGEQWLPFGEEPQPWRYCCLACPDALDLRGAQITVSFSIGTKVYEELLPVPEQEKVFRPIMRRLPAPPSPPRDVYADAVVWEYWNGGAWLPVPGTQRYTGCFALCESPDGIRIKAGFRWPEDAERCEIQGTYAHWLRWRVRRADGMGWLPRRCHAPEVSGVRLSAVLESAPVLVERRMDVNAEFTPVTETQTPLFPPLLPEHDAWWLGFDRPPGAGVLRLYLSLQGQTRGGRLTAWELGSAGDFRQIKLTDGTDGLRHSGVLAMSDIRGGLGVKFGKKCWWLCLQDQSDTLADAVSRPKLELAACGAVQIKAEGDGRCTAGESLSPLRGGMLYGTSLTDAYGGFSEETDLECLFRLRAERHHLGRIVSASDLDELVCSTVRDVVRTRCVRQGDTLALCVLMRSPANHAAAFALRRPEILQLMERKGPLSGLGLKTRICEPNFYTLHVTVWVRSGGAPFSETEAVLLNTLDRFLDPVTGHFNADGWRIGELPSAAQLRTVLRESVPDAVLSELLITAAGPDGREEDVSQVSDPFAIPLGGVHTIREI